MSIIYTYLLLILILLLPIDVFSQCGASNFTFKSGEKVVYHAYYNWGFIWIDAGEVTFTTDLTDYKGNKTYKLNSKGRTHKNYDWLYKVRDSFECYIDTAKLRPYYFRRTTSEGGYNVDNKYIFDYNSQNIFSETENSKKPKTLDTLELNKCVWDVLSAVYFVRNINFELYEENDKIDLSLIIDNKVFDLYVRYRGKEEVSTRDGRTFRCLKFSPLLVEGTIFTSGEDMTVWVTDDNNRIPVIVEAKILIGSVKAVLNSYSGIRHPVESLIE